jgi:hypothetical protein
MVLRGKGIRRKLLDISQDYYLMDIDSEAQAARRKIDGCN